MDRGEQLSQVTASFYGIRFHVSFVNLPSRLRNNVICSPGCNGRNAKPRLSRRRHQYNRQQCSRRRSRPTRTVCLHRRRRLCRSPLHAELQLHRRRSIHAAAAADVMAIMALVAGLDFDSVCRIRGRLRRPPTLHIPPGSR
jgi:hypothetical protein